MSLRALALLTSVALVVGCAAEEEASTGDAEAPVEEMEPTTGVGSVVVLEPELEALVAPDAVIEEVAGGFTFTEGPLWRPDEDRLWFSDVVANVLRAVTPEGEVEVLLENAGGESTAPPGSYIGPNGMVADEDGTVLLAQHANRQIVRIGPDLETTVVVDQYDGKRLNSPNDLAIGPGGALYFTDPPYGLPGQDDDPAKELEFNGVYRLADGEAEPVITDLTRPNGLTFSSDMGTLYVANSDEANRVLMAYDVAEDGSVSNGRVFVDATADPAPGIFDGVRVDAQGNVYAAGPGGIWVIAPDGRRLGTIQTPESAANLGWGDDGRTLYITAETSVYRIRMNVSGA
jgi:gluconolactonase